MEIEYLPGNAAGYVDTAQQLIDPGTCTGPEGKSIRPPKGLTKFSVNETGILAARDGWVLNMSKLLIFTSFCSHANHRTAQEDICMVSPMLLSTLCSV